MIFGIGGKLSGGKTCTAVKFAYDRYNDGKKVISNFMVNFPGDQRNIFMNNEQFVDFIKTHYMDQQGLKRMFFNSVLILDEVQNLISSRSSATQLNNLLLNFFMMAGKLDCDIVYTAQVQDSMVDKIIRECTNVYCNCYRITEDGKPLIFENRIYNKRILIVVIMQFDFDVLGQQIRTLIYDPAEFYKFYDTREITLLDRTKYMRGGLKDLRNR